MTISPDRRRFPIDRLPELAAPVGLHGALTRGEVGGSFCFAIVVTASSRVAPTPA